eukprot:11483962-Alexandrium_andersonii.AAC.1
MRDAQVLSKTHPGTNEQLLHQDRAETIHGRTLLHARVALDICYGCCCAAHVTLLQRAVMAIDVAHGV